MDFIVVAGFKRVTRERLYRTFVVGAGAIPIAGVFPYHAWALY